MKMENYIKILGISSLVGHRTIICVALSRKTMVCGFIRAFLVLVYINLAVNLSALCYEWKCFDSRQLSDSAAISVLVRPITPWYVEVPSTRQPCGDTANIRPIPLIKTHHPIMPQNFLVCWGCHLFMTIVVMTDDVSHISSYYFRQIKLRDENNYKTHCKQQ